MSLQVYICENKKYLNIKKRNFYITMIYIYYLQKSIHDMFVMFKKYTVIESSRNNMLLK